MYQGGVGRNDALAKAPCGRPGRWTVWVPLHAVPRPLSHIYTRPARVPRLQDQEGDPYVLAYRPKHAPRPRPRSKGRKGKKPINLRPDAERLKWV